MIILSDSNGINPASSPSLSLFDEVGLRRIFDRIKVNRLTLRPIPVKLIAGMDLSCGPVRLYLVVRRSSLGLEVEFRRLTNITSAFRLISSGREQGRGWVQNLLSPCVDPA
jgi:hypothetical protein